MKNQRSGVSSIRALVEKNTRFVQLNWKTTFFIKITVQQNNILVSLLSLVIDLYS
jgi:hypothetical protein